MSNKVIFIAIPTAGTVRDEQLTPEFIKFLAKLHEIHTGTTFIAPMVQDYQLLQYLNNTAATWEAWGAHCRAIIPRCDEVWVLMFNGYLQSKGVAGEIKCAIENNIPIRYVDPFSN